MTPSFREEIYHFPQSVSVLIISPMEQILVVGAGPAGSACAWRLAVEGIPCVLADRASFPRPKVCGGVVSGRAVKLLTEAGMLSEVEIEDLTVQTHSSLTVSSDFRELRTFEEGNPPISMVNRTEFDAFLRRRALEAGAVPLRDNFMNMSAETAFFLSGRKMVFSRIIGADGACSRVRRSMAHGSFIRPCPALTSVVPLSATAMAPFMKKGLQIFFFSGFTGYGWLFPRREDVVVGVGSFRDTGDSLGNLLLQLMVHTGMGTSSPVRGAILPAGRQKVFPGGGRCLLAGDAAGLCDRVSGEGISHALESGIAAAEAVIRGEETWGEGAECMAVVKQSNLYKHFLYGKPFRGLAMKALSKNSEWYRKYWEIVAGKNTYRSLFKRSSVNLSRRAGPSENGGG